MKQRILIALLALAGFTALPSHAADPAPAPDNLSLLGKPCPTPDKDGKPCPTTGHGHPCPPPCMHGDCKHHDDLEARIEEMQKRIDALQMTVEMLVREGAE